MKKLIFALTALATVAANAGAFIVYVKLPSGEIHSFESFNIPSPDKFGMYSFRTEKTTIVVHASNVWIMSKGKLAK